MIFISDFDPFVLNKVHYEIVPYIKGTDREYDNCVHIRYFNTKVKDETFLSELMQYLADSDPKRSQFGALSQRVNYHKEKNEGKIEGKIETIRLYMRYWFSSILYQKTPDRQAPIGYNGKQRLYSGFERASIAKTAVLRGRGGAEKNFSAFNEIIITNYPPLNYKSKPRFLSEARPPF